MSITSGPEHGDGTMRVPSDFGERAPRTWAVVAAHKGDGPIRRLGAWLQQRVVRHSPPLPSPDGAESAKLAESPGSAGPTAAEGDERALS